MASKVPTDPDLKPEMRRFLDDVARAEERLRTYIDEQIAATALALASQAEAEAGTDNAKYMSALRVAQAIDAQTTAPIFTKSFTSAAQTITAAGSLTLAHGLGAIPELVQSRLVCVTAEFNYSIGDIIIINPTSIENSNVGTSIVPDATNLNIRFGSVATTFIVLNKTTGGQALLTNSRWNFIVKAWA